MTCNTDFFIIFLIFYKWHYKIALFCDYGMNQDKGYFKRSEAMNVEKTIIARPIHELTKSEVMNVGGGFWPIILRIAIPTIINMAIYSFKKHHNDEEITPQGLVIAGGTGVISGGLGVAGGAAAGGGIFGNAVWIPSTTAINASGNLIAEGF